MGIRVGNFLVPKAPSRERDLPWDGLCMHALGTEGHEEVKEHFIGPLQCSQLHPPQLGLHRDPTVSQGLKSQLREEEREGRKSCLLSPALPGIAAAVQT